MFEESAVFKIKDVPVVIQVFSAWYFLVGLVLFNPPIFETDIGHYTAAIRLNNKWEIYDDMRSKPHPISANENAVIHCLFYIKASNECLIRSKVVADKHPKTNGKTSDGEITVCSTSKSDGNSNNSVNCNREAQTRLPADANMHPKSANFSDVLIEDDYDDGSFDYAPHSDSSLFRLYHGHDRG